MMLQGSQCLASVAADMLLLIVSGVVVLTHAALMVQVPAQKGLVAQQQPTAVSQLVPLPPAQQLNPLPAAAAAAIAAGPPQLSVQSTLQSQPPALQPDLTTQLHHTIPNPLPAQANNNLVWVLSFCAP